MRGGRFAHFTDLLHTLSYSTVLRSSHGSSREQSLAREIGRTCLDGAAGEATPGASQGGSHRRWTTTSIPNEKIDHIGMGSMRSRRHSARRYAFTFTTERPSILRDSVPLPKHSWATLWARSRKVATSPFCTARRPMFTCASKICAGAVENFCDVLQVSVPHRIPLHPR